MEIEKIESMEKFLDLKDEWNKLLEENEINEVNLRHEFISLWHKYIGNKNRLFVLVAKENNQIIGIAPLMLSKSFFIKKLEFIGVLNSDYGDFIIPKNKGGILKEMFKFLIKSKEWDLIELRKIPESSSTLKILEEIKKERKIPIDYSRLVITETSKILLDTGWEEYFKSRSKKLRKRMRQYIKYLNKEGILTVEHCNYESMDKWLDVFFKQHQERWKLKNIPSKFHKKEYQEFYRGLAKVFSQDRTINLSSLKLNNKTIATHYGFIYNNKYYYISPSLDLKYTKYSIGNVLIYFLIKDAFEKGLKEFDFGGGREAYKSRWITESENNFQINIFKKGLNIKTKPYVFARKCINKIRQIEKESLLYRILYGIEGFVNKIRFKKVK